MPKVSRQMRGTGFEKDLIRDFWSAINGLNDRERIYFLDKILTPTEKLMLAKRLAILKELGKGSRYEEIGDKLRVISTTIGRMSNILRGSSRLLPILSKIDIARSKREEKKSQAHHIGGSKTLAGTRRLFGL